MLTSNVSTSTQIPEIFTEKYIGGSTIPYILESLEIPYDPVPWGQLHCGIQKILDFGLM